MNNKRKNKFNVNSKSLSLTKVNPYFGNKEHYLPYKYSDPSFKSTYHGPLLQKDFFLINMMSNRLKKNFSFINGKQRNSNSTNLGSVIAKDSVLSFNFPKSPKEKIDGNFTEYAFSLLKEKYFRFNPRTNREKMFQYRNKKSTFGKYYIQNQEKEIDNYLNNYNNEINKRNYQNWEKIKEEYSKKYIFEDKFTLSCKNNNDNYETFKNVININKYLAHYQPIKMNYPKKEKIYLKSNNNKANINSCKNMKPSLFVIKNNNNDKNYLPYLTSGRDNREKNN